MNKVFTENGWADYTFWETEDRKTLKKINKLIVGFDKSDDASVYKIDENNVFILACRYHYSDK